MATGMSGSLYPLAGSLPSATSGASTPPSPGSLATPVATVPLSEPIAPMLDAMEQLNVSAHDPAVGQYMATNLQAWRALQEQMRAWGVVSNNHASFLNSHVSYIANASKKLKELHLGVKDKVREIEGTVSRGFTEIQTKIVELETRFNQAHDVSGLVAAEVGKHHSAFSLLGSEVERVRQRLQTSETAAVAMRNAIDKIVEEIES